MQHTEARDPDVGALALYRALQELTRSSRAKESEQVCGHGITRTECYGLEALSEQGPMTLNELAASLRLDKSTTSRAAQSLQEKGLAARAGHPADGRALQLGATARGRQLYRRILAETVACYRCVLDGVPPQTQTALIELLRRLSQAEATQPAACRR